MFTAGTAAEIAVHHQDRGPLITGLIKGMLTGEFKTIVGKHLVTQRLETHAFEEPCRNDPIRVDVFTRDGDGRSTHLLNRTSREESHHDADGEIKVRTSVTRPLTAAAATMAGLINKVRPLADPCRPLKLRLLELALI